MRRWLFTGWTVVAGAFFGYAIAQGLMHSYAVFLVAYLGEFGWGRAETSVAYSVSQLVIGISSPLIGALVDRLGTRVLVTAGAVLLAGGLAANATVSSLWQVVLLYGVAMTLGSNCLGLVVSVPILSRWFVRRRGLAISVVQSANGFGRAASAPVVQLLISAIGWRRSYLALAAMMAAAVIPIVRAFPTREPAAADAGPGARPLRPAPSAHVWTVATAMRTPHFWLLFAVYLLTGLGSFLVSLHQLAWAIDVGFDPLYAASVLGTGSLLAVAGTIGTGTISDYIGREVSAILAYVVSIVGVICALFITSPDQHALLWLHACFFGLTWGARGPQIRQDRRPIPGSAPRCDPGRDLDRHRPRRGGWRLGGRVDLRSLRQLPARVPAVHRLLRGRLRRLLDAAPARAIGPRNLGQISKRNASDLFCSAAVARPGFRKRARMARDCSNGLGPDGWTKGR